MMLFQELFDRQGSTSKMAVRSNSGKKENVVDTILCAGCVEYCKHTAFVHPVQSTAKDKPCVRLWRI